MTKTERDIESEMERLRRAAIPEASRNRIYDYILELRLNNASPDKIYYYAIRLRQISQTLGEKFLSPSADELKKMLETFLKKKQGHSDNSGGTYSESAMQAYKTVMKQFYAWNLKTDDPECTRWIKVGMRINRNKKPAQPLQYDAVKVLASSAKNQRDKLLIWLLYDSGCRIGELLTLKFKDIEFDEQGMRISVYGKTGWRSVRVIGDSINEMKSWMELSEFATPDDFVFHVISGETKGRPMGETNVRFILQELCGRSGISYRVYAHLFRHTRATILAQNVAQAPLAKQMGWTQGSPMMKVYVHLSDKQTDDAIVDAYKKEKRS